MLAPLSPSIHIDFGAQGYLPQQCTWLKNDLPLLLHGQHTGIAFLRQVSRSIAVSHFAQAEIQQVSVVAGQHDPKSQ